MKSLALSIAAFALAVSLGTAAQAQQTTKIEVTFFDHHTAGMIEQDAFVETAPGSNEVIRVGKDEAAPYLNRPVFGSTQAVHHAPFNAAANGPHPKGTRIGMTLGQWLAGSGTGTYTCTADTGTLEVNFTGLVADGTYTMWNFYAGKAHMGCADCPFATIDFPVGAADGSQSPFKADAQGNATYAATFTPCIQLGTDRFAAGLAIAYHSDGKTHGPTPGQLGSASHVQLFTVLPDEGTTQTAAN